MIDDGTVVRLGCREKNRLAEEGQSMWRMSFQATARVVIVGGGVMGVGLGLSPGPRGVGQRHRAAGEGRTDVGQHMARGGPDHPLDLQLRVGQMCRLQHRALFRRSWRPRRASP